MRTTGGLGGASRSGQQDYNGGRSRPAHARAVGDGAESAPCRSSRSDTIRLPSRVFSAGEVRGGSLRMARGSAGNGGKAVAAPRARENTPLASCSSALMRTRAQGPAYLVGSHWCLCPRARRGGVDKPAAPSACAEQTTLGGSEPPNLQSSKPQRTTRRINAHRARAPGASHCSRSIDHHHALSKRVVATARLVECVGVPRNAVVDFAANGKPRPAV